ncbi:UDP-N-acetylglucosamine 2-epimerase (non-hydrolyzing), partial [Candidatus Bathyarchaeota archaeon]|nr:UDP-N-acetylglucosamine 2-epimerase (non-hydrolyzing) [Candidatus Bathyarchaeota archaeon]
VRLSGLQRAIDQIQPDIVLAVGDTYTVAYSALTSHHLGIPFCHIEAGLRSFDESMPEEGNRIVADHLAEICLCPTSISATNLSMEATPPNRVYVTGNTIVDCCLKYSREAVNSNIVERLGLKANTPLILLTVHRVENTDDPQRLGRIVDAITGFRYSQIVFPVHPRTKDRLKRSGLNRILSEASNVIVAPPLRYIDFLKVLIDSDLVLTDSGGVQEEATILGKRCLVLRGSTERPETVISGNCRVIGVENLKRAMSKPISNQTWPIPQKYGGVIGDGRSGPRIANILIKQLKRGFKRQPKYFDDGYASYRLVKVRGQIPRLKGLRVAGDTSILQAYNENGEPSWPGDFKKLRRVQNLMLLGSPSHLRSYRP